MIFIFNKYFKTFSFIFFFILTFYLRYFSFQLLNLDDDEGIYLLMGKFILDGYFPYIHFFDHQPPLIYLLASSIQLMGFKSIIGVRILTSVFLLFTAFFLNLSACLIFKRKLIAIFTGTFYIIAASSHHVGGLSFNNELIFNFFIISSFYFLIMAFISEFKIKRKIFLSGLLIGFGFLTKQQVFYDFISFLILFFFISYFNNKKYKYYIPIYIISASIPILITCIIYLSAGFINDFILAIWKSNLIYVSSGEINKGDFIYFINNIKHYIFLIPLVFFTLLINNSKIHSNTYNNWFKFFLFIWLSINLYGVSLSKTYYLHYFIQVLLPLSLLLGYSLNTFINITPNLRIFSIIIFIFFITFFSYKNLYIKPYKSIYKESAVYKASKYISKNKLTSDTLFVIDSDVIIYYLTNSDILTKYAFPIHLTNPKYADAFDFNQENEFSRIMNLNPVWLIIEDSLSTSYRDIKNFTLKQILHSHLKKYELKKIFIDNNGYSIKVFRLKMIL